MSRKNNNNVSLGSILSSLVIILIVVVSLGYFIIRTDTFSSSWGGFYLKVGDDRIVSDEENYSIVLNKEYKVEVFSDIDFEGTGNNYKVYVVPNELYDFSFSESEISGGTITPLALTPSGSGISPTFPDYSNVDEVNPFLDGEKEEGVTYWSDLEYITDIFYVSVYDDYFTFVARADLSSIVSFYYPSSSYLVVRTAIDTDIPFFRLVVQDLNSGEMINVNFNVKSE